MALAQPKQPTLDAIIEELQSFVAAHPGARFVPGRSGTIPSVEFDNCVLWIRVSKASDGEVELIRRVESMHGIVESSGAAFEALLAQAKTPARLRGPA